MSWEERSEEGRRLAELRRSNAAGNHADKRDRRRRTRAARKAAEIQERMEP